MDAQSIITEVSKQLNDIALVTWTQASLFEYIDSAQQAIVNIRPDANAIVTVMPMVTGTKQTLPTAGIRLLEVRRNMGTGGTTPGKAIVSCDHATLALYNSGWHTATATAEIDNFAYDEKTPKVFYVDPPSDGTVQIEITYASIPTKIALAVDILDLKDQYRNAIVQWCMFRAYSVEVDSASSQSRARKHEQTFNDIMDKKMQRDIMYSPSEAVKGGG